jgi:hypothetical protein
MSFNNALKLPFLDNVPGNAAAYVKLNECIPELQDWADENWQAAKIMYYMTVPNPGSAWLHDVYKNKCKYNIHKTYKFIHELLEKSTD